MAADAPRTTGEPPRPPGRGAAINSPNRFEPIRLEPDPDWDPALDPAPATLFYHDVSQSIITYNDSPDLGFRASINPYRGCEHGCIYCYARPTHEYLGFSAGLDFESRILVKREAAMLLRRELASAKWSPQVIALSGVTDPYQPVERRLGVTRQCLEVLAQCRNPVAVVTKNHLVTRDLDHLAELARFSAVVLYLSVTTLDRSLAACLEPRTSQPGFRLEAIAAARNAGVPVGVLMAPVIPGLNDHEIPAVLQAAAEAGAQFAGYVLLRLPHGVGSLFEHWLKEHFPERRSKILAQIMGFRGGRLNDAQFGSRMRGEGPAAQRLRDLFGVARRRAGLAARGPDVSIDSFRRPPSRGEFQQELSL